MFLTRMLCFQAKKNPKQWLQGKVVKWVTERKRLLTSRKGERVSMWRTSAVVPMSTSKTQRSESVPLTPQLQLKSPRVGRLIKAASVPPPAPEKRQKHLRQGGRRSQHRRNFFSGRHCEGQNLCSQFKMLSFDSVCTATSDGQDSSLTVGELLQEDVSFFSSSSSDADIIRSKFFQEIQKKHLFLLD